MSMSNKIFISYSSSDHKFVEQLANRLQKDRLKVWIADWEIKVGDSIVEKINRGLEDSGFFVIVLSNISAKSTWVRKELNSALMRQLSGKDIKILPVLLDLDPINIPPLLSDIAAVKFSASGIGDKEYQRLLEPIKEKKQADLLHQYQDRFFENAYHIDIALEKKSPTKQEVEFILGLITQEPYGNYFFRNSKSTAWFDILQSKGFFEPNPDTAPQPTEPEGHYHLPQWNVLPYLEKISQQVNEPGNKIYSDQLLNIIHKVTDYHIKHDKILDNYRIWWYFAKILYNLPNEKIDDKVLDLIPIWLDSKFDNSLPGSEILKRLLPKFLDSDNPADRVKVEKLIEIVTEVDLEREKASTIIDPYWLTELLRKRAARIAIVCNKDVVFNIAHRLKQIFRKKHGHAYPTFEFKGYKYMMSIEYTSDTDYSVDIVLQNEVLEKKEKSESKFSFTINNIQNEKEFIKAIKEKIKDNDNFKELRNELDSDLDYIYEKIPQDFSYLWFEDLSLDGESIKTNPATALTAILRDIILEKAKMQSKKTVIEINDIFCKFFNVEYRYPIFKRIVFFVINRQWDIVKEFFWEIIDSLEGEKFFSDSVFEPELYSLLEMNVHKFTQSEKEKIKKIIDKGPQENSYTEKQKAYWKQKWYSAMKSDSYFAPLYTEQQKLTQIKEEEIGFKEPTTRTGPGPSPLSIEEIIRMSNKDLANRLKVFKTEDFWRGPTVGGLAEQLKLAAQTNPEKFLGDMRPFIQTAYFYVYHILWGIREAWQKKQIISWTKLFNFINQYIESPDFWENKYKIEDDRWHASYLLVIGVIGELIIQGTKSDNWVFSEEYFETAQKILFAILGKILPEKEKIQKEYPPTGDYVTYALNSTFGKITEALFLLALRIKRIEEKTKKEERIDWTESIKDKYDEILRNQIIEGYVWLGRYLPNFYYLDKAWVESKVKTISIEKPDLWEAFMEGYLFSSRIYNELYKLMKQHYLTALDYEFKDKHSIEGFVQHIGVGYLRGIEEIDEEDSLFRSILNKWRPIQVKEIIGYFWMQRDWLVRTIQNDVEITETDEIRKYKDRIIAFWRWVYKNKYKEKVDISEQDKKILSELSKLAIFLPKIDTETFKWLKLSAQYVHFGFNASFFIKYLDYLKSKNEKAGTYTGKIYLEILKNSTPDFDEKHIRSIVEYLYNSCRKEIANEICNIYGASGFEFLRDIYDKYNKNCKSN